MKDGQPARGVTKWEFLDLMVDLKRVLNEVLATPLGRQKWYEATGGYPEVCPPIFSFDNPSIHTDPTHLIMLGLSDFAGLPTPSRLVLPPHSGDLHRTIERVHARICGYFQDWLYDDTAEYCMEGYCAKLRHIFYSTQQKNVIQKCIKDISKLYTRVVELNGGITERKYR